MSPSPFAFREWKNQVLAPGAWRKLPALALLALGWLLSPLCWWNDLVINLPLAFGFAKLVSWFHPTWMLPALVVGYWLSNIAGVLLLQNGLLALLPKGSQTQGSRGWIRGLLTSTLYSLAIVLAMKLGWLGLPHLDAFLSPGPPVALAG